jgi:hypothetical protein
MRWSRRHSKISKLCGDTGASLLCNGAVGSNIKHFEILWHMEPSQGCGRGWAHPSPYTEWWPFISRDRDKTWLTTHGSRLLYGQGASFVPELNREWHGSRW